MSSKAQIYNTDYNILNNNNNNNNDDVDDIALNLSTTIDIRHVDHLLTIFMGKTRDF